MDRFEAMRTLLAAVDGGSLSAASRTLNLPLPTVSRRVSDLEAHLRSQLVVRTSRRLQLTDAGAAFVESARRVLEELAEAERTAMGEYRTPRGELLVTAPIMFGKLHVAPVVQEFLAAYPEVTVRLVLTDGVIDLVDHHVDVAIRIGKLPDSALIARRVGAIRWVTCASPEYLRRRGTPEKPEDLLDHDCIAYEGLELEREWPFSGPNGTFDVKIRPRYSVNTGDAVINGTLAGLGICCVLSYQVADLIRDGSLVSILNDWASSQFPVQIVNTARPYQPLKLRAFLDFATPKLEERMRRIAERYKSKGINAASAI